MNCVLDACAMIAYLRNEAGADVVESALLDTNSQCVAHTVNLCEVYKEFDPAAAAGICSITFIR